MLEIELSVRRIPFVKYGGIRFTEAAHVKDFMAAARVVTNPADDLAWFRLLRLHEGIGPVHARRVIGAAGPGRAAPLGALEAHAADVLPPRSRPAVSATCPPGRRGGGGSAPPTGPPASWPRWTPRSASATPMPGIRLADLQRLADAAATRPSLHDALVELALDPPLSASDLAGPPRLDDDYLVLSTIHSAKGLEWPVVHLLQLVDGAVPSDMALSSRDGLDEERRLFYVAVTRARDQLYLYAPLRMHHHRMAADDRHGYGQLTRFLDPGRAGRVRRGGRHAAGTRAAQDRAAGRDDRRRARLPVRPRLTVRRPSGR